MTLFYLGFAVPESEVDILYKDERPAVQTVNFSNRFRRALQKIDADLINFYAYPIQNYPKHSSFFSSGAHIGCDVRLTFINFIILKHLTRFFSLVFSFFRIMKKPDSVVVHGLHSPYLLAALLLKVLGAKVFVVITDPPGVILKSDSSLARFLKLVDKKFVFSMLSFFNGAVILSENIRNFVPNIKVVTINSIIDDAQIFPEDLRIKENLGEIRMVYGGSLDAIYGVDNIIKLAEVLEGSNVKIDVYGSGHEEGKLIKACSRIKSLSYYGFLPYDDFKNRLTNYDLLLNLRVVDCDESKFSFPSKLSEAVMLGVPVLTTPVSSLERDVDSPFYITKSDSLDDILDKLNIFFELSEPQKRINLYNSQLQLLEQYSVTSVANKLSIFFKE